MTNYNEIFNTEKNQKFFDIINNNMLLLLNGNEFKIFTELIHLNNINQKITIRTIMRFTRINSNRAAQQAIKTLRTIGIIGDTGYTLNLNRIEEIYNKLNSIVKLDDKLAYCDSLLNGEQSNIVPEAIQQEEEEPIHEEQPIYNKVEQQEQPTINIEPTQEPIKEQPMQEYKEEPIQEPIKEEEVMNNEEVTTTVQEQPKNIVPSKQELEKNIHNLLNKMMTCDSVTEWNDKQNKLVNYFIQNKTWTNNEIKKFTDAIFEAKTLWQQEKYTKSMSLINAAQCGI